MTYCLCLQTREWRTLQTLIVDSTRRVCSSFCGCVGDGNRIVQAFCSVKVASSLAMDVTLLFKACVKTLRTRNKALGVVHDGDRNAILKPRQPRSDFHYRVREIVSRFLLTTSLKMLGVFYKVSRSCEPAIMFLLYLTSVSDDLCFDV